MARDHEQTRGAVARLYEEYPYPDHGVVGSTVARLARSLLDQIDPSTPLRILDAGCGTGEQTLGLKRAHPGAEVVGLDLNPRSIQRARAHARDHRLDVEFVEADLLDLPASLGEFSVVTSVGVLHHLPDPVLGLRALREVVRRDGGLLGMVYGRYGKWEMFRDRDAIARLAGTDDRERRLAVAGSRRGSLLRRVAAGLAELDRRRRFGPDLPVGEALRRVRAGRNRAFAADSYTHAQEVTFTWAQLDAALRSTGWEPRGWPARSGMPDAPEQLLSGTALRAARALTPQARAEVYELLVRPANLYFLARPAEGSATS